jgi:hypothetical protein
MRNPLLTRFVCCWLAALVLLGSTGFGVVDHWCQMRGHTKSMLLAEKDCTRTCSSDLPDAAPVSALPVVKKSPCCKTTLSYEHVDVSRFLTDQHGPTAPTPIDFQPALSFVYLFPAPVPVASAADFSPFVADDPLIRSGRFRLLLGCTWLI